MNFRFASLLIKSFLLGLLPVVHAQMLEVPPYIQPGTAHDLNHESKVIIWQTDSTKADFIVEYQKGTSFDGSAHLHHAKVVPFRLELGKEVSWLYRAHLEHLEFDSEYVYRVRLENRPISQAVFRTRTIHPKTRFAVFGDCGVGSPGQAAVAYQVSKLNPDFVLLTGDNVYNNGLARDRKSTRLNSSHIPLSRMPSSA